MYRSIPMHRNFMLSCIINCSTLKFRGIYNGHSSLVCASTLSNQPGQGGETGRVLSDQCTNAQLQPDLFSRFVLVT